MAGQASSLLWRLVKMSRLHCITPRQGRKPSVLSEELLLAQKREVKPCLSRRSPQGRRRTASFAIFCFSKMLLRDCLLFNQAIPHFWQKKWRRGRDSTRAQRSEREHRRPSVEKRRATHKKITLSAPCRKQQRKNEKTQEQVYLHT